jgi:hypothetical protein
MSLRTFVDSAGQEWQAFDVVPRDDERRHYDRRASGELTGEDQDDRREGDRRITVGRASRIGGPQSGWLCFESGDERRRLSPIPNDWRRCPENQLEAYCRAARPVRPLTFTPPQGSASHSS